MTTKEEQATSEIVKALDGLDTQLDRAKAIGFDIDEKEALAAKEDRGIAVPIRDERGRAVYQEDGTTPITISVVGSLSKRYRAVQELQRGRVMKSTNRTAALTESEEDAGARSLNEQREAVAACITGWSAGFTSKGRDFPFTKENAVRLLKFNPHIQTQLELAMTDHALFFAQSSNGSKP